MIGNYKIDDEDLADALDEFNAQLAEMASKQAFTIEFRDSSDTVYNFEITVYIAATVKIVDETYAGIKTGHKGLGFDKWVIAVDFTDASIVGQNYDPTTVEAQAQPDYKDMYVPAENRADAELPPFDLTTFEYTLEW